MQLDQTLDQGQAEPGARLARVGVGAFESLEHPGLVLRRDADAGVGYREQHFAAGAARRQRDNAARRGKLNRVGNQVEHRLAQSDRVRRNGADIVRAIDLGFQTGLVGALLRHLYEVVQQFANADRLYVELHIIGLDRGQVEDVVDQRHQVRRRLQDTFDVFGLPLGQFAEIAVIEDFRKADDGVQRRSQFVAHIADEFRFDAPGALQRQVALAQGALDTGAVGDIQETQQRVAVGQRHRGVSDIGIVGPAQPAMARGAFRHHQDQPLLELLPIGVGGEKAVRRLDQIADMRVAAELPLRKVPDARQFRVRQLEAAVPAEHRDALMKLVQGLALHFDQRVVGTFQRQTVGHVFHREHQPAKRMGRRHRAYRRFVRQMHQLGIGVDQRVEPAVAFLLEQGEVDIFRQAAPFALPFQDIAQGWFAAQHILLDSGQLGVGGIEELEPPVAAIDGDRRAQSLENLRMGGDMGGHIVLHGLERRRVGRVADRRAARRDHRHLVEFQQPPFGADNHMMAFGLRHVGLRCTLGQRPAATVDKTGAEFPPRFQDGFAIVVAGPRIGQIAAGQLEPLVAPPYRQRQRVQKLAQGRDLAFLARALPRQRVGFRNVGEPDQFGLADAAATHGKDPARPGGEGMVEILPGFA